MKENEQPKRPVGPHHECQHTHNGSSRKEGREREVEGIFEEKVAKSFQFS